MCVCLFGYPIITQEPLDRFALNYNRGTRRATDGLRVIGKIEFPGKPGFPSQSLIKSPFEIICFLNLNDGCKSINYLGSG